MRRTRIKGIANIPPRKKQDLPQKAEEDSNDGKNETSTKTQHLDKIIPELENIAACKKIITEEIIGKPTNSDNADPKSQSCSVPIEKKNKELPKSSKKEEISVLQNVVLIEASEIKSERLRVPESLKEPVVDGSVGSSCKQMKPGEKVSYPKNQDKNDGKTNVAEGVINFHRTSEGKSVYGNIEADKIATLQPPSSSLHKQGIRKLKSPINNASDVGKILSPHTNAGSDSEYSIPPASPNKVNRSRIKAIPRIGYRKISFSASESEDETKKMNCRTRNDSQSSNISGIQDTLTEQPPTPKVKEFSSVIQRKCRRTEWSRKLAEARREFTRKFMSGKPDHKKLTMIDLIFYNPTTNLMNKENKRSESEAEIKQGSKNDELVDNPSEKEDDPPEENEEEKDKISDEENEMPAPQIKIGPAGEIILDEKSVVIESKQTKKNREELQKSQILDGNSDRPYGVFKKVKRSKDWTHPDTLRFYKALSTIGTDFSLMCELFPTRTRRELKMKFKKEEKINQVLVDKALMQPCGFDFNELKKEFELAEIEKRELESQKIRDEKLRRNKENKRSIKFVNITHENKFVKSTSRGSDPSASKPSEAVLLNSEDHIRDKPEVEKVQNISERDNNSMKLEQKKQRKGKLPNQLKKRTQKKLDIMAVLSDSNDSASSGNEESEIVWRPTQTRYGRKTRKRRMYEPDAGMEEELIIPRKIQRPRVENEPVQKPGSIMMISSKNAEGEPVVQIFMVTDKKVQDSKQIDGVDNLNRDNLLPIAVIKGHTDDEFEEIVERNITIPAEPENQHVTISESPEGERCIKKAEGNLAEQNTLTEPNHQDVTIIESPEGEKCIKKVDENHAGQSIPAEPNHQDVTIIESPEDEKCIKKVDENRSEQSISAELDHQDFMINESPEGERCIKKVEENLAEQSLPAEADHQDVTIIESPEGERYIKKVDENRAEQSHIGEIEDHLASGSGMDSTEENPGGASSMKDNLVDTTKT